mmetsp:Transcript_60050/g.178049  ORF Transcript_60050/g.178049 Transcript_60050/m.178049 type:complete len:153 (+) Transcript_60050:2415-2873(+)
MSLAHDETSQQTTEKAKTIMKKKMQQTKHFAVCSHQVSFLASSVAARVRPGIPKKRINVPHSIKTTGQWRMLRKRTWPLQVSSTNVTPIDIIDAKPYKNIGILRIAPMMAPVFTFGSERVPPLSAGIFRKRKRITWKQKTKRNPSTSNAARV